MTDVMEMENLLSSMSTAFNSSPTPGDGASVIDLNMNDDKTLKWRRHFKNQYAKKNQRKSAEDGSVTTGATDEKLPQSTTDGDVGVNGNEGSHVENTTPTLQPAVVQFTAATDNSAADNSNKDTERETAKQKKAKKSTTASPSRRSKRTKVELIVSPAVPQKRRGRSKKVIETAVETPEEVKLETATSPRQTDEVKEVETVKKKRKLPVRNYSNDNSSGHDVKLDVAEIQEPIANGNSNGDRDMDVKKQQKKGRRSVRLETKSDVQETFAVKQSSIEITEITEEVITQPESILVAKEEEQEINQTEGQSKLAEKTPRKRGRRSKAATSSPDVSSDGRILSKKSLRLSKDIPDNSLPNIIVSKEKQNDMPALSSQRPLRRIKPTVKILENEELRYEFESKNIARIVAINDKVSEVDSSRSSSRKDTKENSAEMKNSTTPIKKKLFSSNHSADLIYPLKISKPCPEPEDFLNEIKAAGINLHRSPEDKKLNRKQHRKLIKQKEKLFERLGLRRNPKQDASTDSEELSSDNEEFIPSKKISVGKTNAYALRMRSMKANGSFSETHRNSLQASYDLSKRMERVEGALQPISHKNPAITYPKLNIICSCQSISQFYANRTSHGIYCSAVDHVEEHRIGCCNMVRGGEVVPLFRPSARVPYLVLCDEHLKRFKSHNSCAGCGLFCTQGKFILCKHKHFFHPGCAQKLILNTPYDPANKSNHPSPTLVLKCPHCGCDTPEKESLVTMRCQTAPVYLPSQTAVPVIKPARMTLSSRRRTIPSFHTRLQQDLELIKLIPESVMNVIGREFGVGSNDFTTKDMFYAINNDDLERVAEIIASGYDVTSEMKEFLNGTCLHLVSHFGTIQMAYLLLCRSPTATFMNLPDRELRTAAMCAIMGEKCDILKLLIQTGADISKKGPRGMHCLHYAAKCGSLPAAQLLVESYSSSASIKKFYDFLNTKDDMGWTPLVWATEIGRTDIVSFLMNYGADISICDKENLTALHWAVLSNCDDIVKVLLQANADCNVQSLRGDTPLHIACRRLNTSACLVLIASGADLMIKNRDDQLPYDCFNDEEHPCARAVGFNMQMRSFGPSGLQNKIACSDISNGREIYPIQVVRRDRISKFDNDDDVTILPDFKYITKTILLQNSIQIDCRVSQMRICTCDDGCASDQCQCTSISLQNWYNDQGVLIEEFNFEDPPMIFECNDVCGCHIASCRNRVVQRGITLPLQVFECSERSKGFGVRSLIDIECGQFVAEYTGEILTDMEADRRTDDSYFFDLGSSDHCIDANYYGNVSRFFNHSCEPNIVPVRVYFDHQDYRFPKIAFFASHDIEPGEELAFDYGDKFWAVKQTKFSCKCASSECRYSNNEQNQ